MQNLDAPAADAALLKVRGAVSAECLGAGGIDHRDDRGACAAYIGTERAELVAHAENTVVMVDEAGAVRLVDAVLHGDAQVLQIAREERGRHQRRARKVVDRVLAGVGRRQHAAGLFGFQLKGRDHNGKADLFGNRHAHAVHAPPLHRRSDEAA